MAAIHRLPAIHLSLIFEFLKCLPFRVCLAYSLKLGNFDMLFLVMGFISFLGNSRSKQTGYISMFCFVFYKIVGVMHLRNVNTELNKIPCVEKWERVYKFLTGTCRNKGLTCKVHL